MRFGSFVFSISGEPDGDHLVIDDTLREVELAEEVGMDAVWLTEHHFDGAVAYADPVVFGAAVAMRTRRVKIGFAVVEMALHHPVRLAAQTALLDNLSHGRLIVGTGRGSAYNEYEYFGFGLTLEEGREMLPEAEELLVKAWTGEDVDHQGRFWNSRFPVLRPRPYQQPHPPLVRACISEESTVEMARIGRPVLMGIHPVDTLRRRLEVYRDTMLGAGFSRRRWRPPLTRPGGSGGFTWRSPTMRRGRWRRERCGVSAPICWMPASSTIRAAFRPGTRTSRRLQRRWWSTHFWRVRRRRWRRESRSWRASGCGTCC